MKTYSRYIWLRELAGGENEILAYRKDLFINALYDGHVPVRCAVETFTRSMKGEEVEIVELITEGVAMGHERLKSTLIADRAEELVRILPVERKTN